MSNSTFLNNSLWDRIRAWAVLSPPVLLLGAAYWLSQQVLPLPPAADSSKRHDPDFIVDKFNATTFSLEGKPRFIVAAQKMLHYPDNDSTFLEAPRLTSLPPDSPALYANANKGTVSGKGDEIFLHDEVRLVRAASPTQSELVFSSNYLHVLPDRDLADTDQAVTMVDAHNRINALGMQLDNKARTIKLLAQVNSEHDPVKHAPVKK
ncbi:MAG: LPS export ABC transporter periplasmic protein LptC [Gallionellaceae bacterium]|nr:LPS export ABC transporter periplasmic protein LptC [Gallionellaceae bacterium]